MPSSSEILASVLTAVANTCRADALVDEDEDDDEEDDEDEEGFPGFFEGGR